MHDRAVFDLEQDRPADFLSRIRVFAHDDAKFGQMEDRIALIEHWRGRLERLDAMTARVGAGAIGPLDQKRLGLMRGFRDHDGAMMETIADTLHARSFETLREYEFDDPPAPP